MLGEVIHGYRVDRALAADKGGMGDVFFATHVESGAEAVVKVLKPEMSAHRDIVTRFFNEARAAASIHHPGIVQIHNVGYHHDRAYLLMEKLRGDDLETRLKAGPLPVDRAIVFMRQTAGAIAAAHERGIVHRDLKPANLFVVRDPDVMGGERVKVLDFGIAKLSVDAGAGKTQGVFGTPAYMSPEQCASAGAVDARADLYSLGCIFYELVCGRPPFGHGGIELIAAHLRDVPTPPRVLASWLPPAIEQVIMALLEKQPDRRIQSCAALIAALDQASEASGLPAGTAPKLPPGGISIGGVPQPSMPSMQSMPPATGSATEPRRMTTQVRPRSKAGVWIGIGGVVIAGGAVAAVLATRGAKSNGGGTASGSGPVAAVVAIDAGVAGAVVAPVDAAPAVATAPPDAAPIATTPRPIPSPHVGGAGAVSASQAASAAELFRKGTQAVKAGRYAEAEAALMESAVLVPSAATYLNLGIAEYQSGEFGKARLAFEAVLSNAPTAEQAKKVALLIAKNDAEIDKLGHAKPEPKQPEPKQPEPKQPVASAGGADVDKAAKLSQDGKSALFSNHFGEAIDLFKQAYALDPRPQTLFNLGVAQYEFGACADARRTFQLLLGSSPPETMRDKAQKMLDKIGAC